LLAAILTFGGYASKLTSEGFRALGDHCELVAVDVLAPEPDGPDICISAPTLLFLKPLQKCIRIQGGVEKLVDLFHTHVYFALTEYLMHFLDRQGATSIGI
jgi:hypothetical protein